MPGKTLSYCVSDALNNPVVRAIVEELTVVCEKHDETIPELLSALAHISQSACKSFGVHPLAFTQNFEKLYNLTEKSDLVPAPIGGSSS